MWQPEPKEEFIAWVEHVVKGSPDNDWLSGWGKRNGQRVLVIPTRRLVKSLTRFVAEIKVSRSRPRTQNGDV